MQILLIILTLEAGWIPGGNIDYLTTGCEIETVDPSNLFNFSFQAELLFYDRFFIRLKLDNKFWKTIEGVGFAPDRDIYDFSVGYKFYGFEAGYMHQCSHPWYLYVNQYGPGTVDFEGAVNTIYLKYQVELSPFGKAE